MNNSDLILDCRDLKKSYTIGKQSIDVLTDINWQLPRGRWAAILGASGSGKTTLLNLIGALEKATRGTILVNGVDCGKLSSRNAGLFRNQTLGFIFQAYHLLPELSVLENVMLPGLFAGLTKQICRMRAVGLIDRVGLSGRIAHRPSEMSGGEQQRCAIARALINNPELILADEPTGNLDAHTGNEILTLFQELHDKDQQHTIIMITHSEKVAALADSIHQLENGVLQNPSS